MTFSEIKLRVRENAGWSDIANVSIDRIEQAINYVYTHMIPAHLRWQGLQKLGYIDLSDGDDGSYSFTTDILDASGGTAYGSRVRSVETLFHLIVDSTTTYELNYTYDRSAFWSLYPPLTTETTGQPLYVLLQSKTLYVRPVPDDTYVLRCVVNLRPSALSDGNDEPVEDWSEAIISGATAELAKDDGDDQGVVRWTQDYYQKLSIEVQDEQSSPPGTIIGRW